MKVGDHVYYVRGGKVVSGKIGMLDTAGDYQYAHIQRGAKVDSLNINECHTTRVNAGLALIKQLRADAARYRKALNEAAEALTAKEAEICEAIAQFR